MAAFETTSNGSKKFDAKPVAVCNLSAIRIFMFVGSPMHAIWHWKRTSVSENSILARFMGSNKFWKAYNGRTAATKSLSLRLYNSISDALCCTFQLQWLDDSTQTQPTGPRRVLSRHSSNDVLSITASRAQGGWVGVYGVQSDTHSQRLHHFTCIEYTIFLQFKINFVQLPEKIYKNLPLKMRQIAARESSNVNSKIDGSLAVVKFFLFVIHDENDIMGCRRRCSNSFYDSHSGAHQAAAHHVPLLNALIIHNYKTD